MPQNEIRIGNVPDLVRVSTAARLLGMSRPAVYMAIATGRLGAQKIDEQLYVSRTEVEQLRTARERARETA